MTEKWHINKDGVPGACKARYMCRFGSLETGHYPTREAAMLAFESSMKAIELRSLSKSEEPDFLVTGNSRKSNSWEQPNFEKPNLIPNSTEEENKFQNYSNQKDSSLPKEYQEFPLASTEAKKELFNKLLEVKNQKKIEEENGSVYLGESISKELKYLRVQIASSSKISDDQVKQLVNDPEDLVRMNLASNPNIPVGRLITLAKDSSKAVRMYAAKNPNLPKDLLTAFSNSTDSMIKSGVAANPTVDEETLKRFSTDNSANVKIEVGLNPSSSTDVIKKLASDNGVGILYVAAKHSNLDIKTFNKLNSKADEFLSRGDSRNGWGLKSALAENPIHGHLMLKKIEKIERPELKRALLNNPKVDLQTKINIYDSLREDELKDFTPFNVQFFQEIKNFI